MSAHPHPRLTPEEYLALDRAAEFRSEYYDGEMFAMSGGSLQHATIITNISGELRTELRGKKCRAIASELRVRVAKRTYVFPDVVVFCDPAQFADDQADTLLNPTILIEVLSPSTEKTDRGTKAVRYRTIEALREYALVSQDEPRVEVYRRQPSGEWLLSEFAGLDAVCRFDGAGESIRIPLSEIYDRVPFAGEDLSEQGFSQKG